MATYDYRDLDGSLLFQKVRLHPKDFRVRRPDGRGGWEWRIGDAPRVLYRLPEVRAAVAAGKVVVLVEGEKDADRVVAELGMAATCNYEGAAKDRQRPKWRQEYTEQLRGANVLIVADNDEAGIVHARAVCSALAGTAAKVRIFRAAVDDPKADISDHLDAGHGIQNLLPVPTNYESNERKEETKKHTSVEPQLHKSAFHGLLGKVVQRLEPVTEASPAAMLTQLIAYSGAFLGDRVFTLAGGSPHPPGCGRWSSARPRPVARASPEPAPASS